MILYRIFLPFLFLSTAPSRFSAPRYPLSPWTVSTSPVTSSAIIVTSWMFAAVTFTVCASPMSLSTPTYALYPKCQVFPFFVEWASGSRFFSLFLVLVGAKISVESTIVPFFSSSPRSWSSPVTRANSFSYIPLRISRFRNRSSVSPSVS